MVKCIAAELVQVKAPSAPRLVLTYISSVGSSPGTCISVWMVVCSHRDKWVGCGERKVRQET